MTKLFFILSVTLLTGCSLLFKKEVNLNFGATAENKITGDDRTLGPIQKNSENLDEFTVVSIAVAGALPSKTISIRGQLKCIETFMDQKVISPLKNRRVTWRIDRGSNLTEIKGESASDQKGFFFVDLKDFKTEYFENLDIEIRVGDYFRPINYQKFSEPIVLNEQDCQSAKRNK